MNSANLPPKFKHANWHLPSIKWAWWTVLILLTALFFVALYHFLIDTSAKDGIKKLWDALAGLLSLVGCILVGFGVALGKGEANELTAHVTALSERLEQSGLSAAATACDAWKTIKDAQGPPAKDEAQALAALASGLHEANQSLNEASTELKAIFAKQVEMARDATIWFEIGIVLVILGSGLTTFFTLARS